MVSRAYLLLMMKMKERKDEEGKEKKRRKEEKGSRPSLPSINARTAYVENFRQKADFWPDVAHTLTHVTLTL